MRRPPSTAPKKRDGADERRHANIRLRRRRPGRRSHRQRVGRTPQRRPRPHGLPGGGGPRLRPPCGARGLVCFAAQVLGGWSSKRARQRVAIARALVPQPAVLVLDEAVSALDLSVQAQVLGLLADLREQRAVSYVFVTHDLAVAQQITDEVLVVHLGRVVEQGPTDRILSTPEHPYTRGLLDAVPRAGWRPGGAAASPL